jgi:hypothetical protein
MTKETPEIWEVTTYHEPLKSSDIRIAVDKSKVEKLTIEISLN